MSELMILTREPSPDILKLMEQADNVELLLLGDGVLVHPSVIGDKRAYVLQEEIEERGIGLGIPPNVTVISASDAIDMLLDHKVFNLT